MIANSQILRSAMNEVDNPRFAVTKQILGVHRVVRVGDEPTVAGVDESFDASAVFVFFALEDEPYHLWIRVGAASAAVEFAGIEPSSSVSLVVESENIEPTDITKVLGLVPTKTREKGTVRSAGVGCWKQHSWSFEPCQGEVLFLETKLRRLLAITNEKRERFASIANQSVVEISIVSWQWSAWSQGFGFDAATIAAFASWGASLDIDLYSSGPPEMGDGDT